MKSFQCPFCNSSFPLIDETYEYYQASFESHDSKFWDTAPSNSVNINFYKCPSCKKTTIKVTGASKNFADLNVPIYPNSLAKHFPEYIPKSIRQDYEEAYSILNLSPKASATLSRRCLQGMIRDFYKITKSRLFDEINELQNIVPASQREAINAVRSIGNIGAHMEKDVNVIIDVDPDESEKLLKLIELLIDKWYIARHDEEELLKDITQIAEDKKSKKQSNSSN